MFLRLQLLRNLRTLASIVLIVIAVGCIAGLVYLNRIGLTDDLRGRVAGELEKQGIYAQFASLHYDVLNGLVVQDVALYATEAREREIASFGKMSLAVDKTKAMRGIVKLERISLKRGAIRLPVDPEVPDGAALVIENLEGKVSFPQKKLLDLQRLTGQVAGLDVSLSGLITLPAKPKDENGYYDEEALRAQRLMTARVIEEIGRWNYTERARPRVDVRLEGDLDRPELLTTRFSLNAPKLVKADYELEEVSIQGAMEGRLLTISDLHLRDKSGEFDAEGFYHLSRYEGELKVKTTMAVQAMVVGITGKSVAPELEIAGASDLSGSATFSFVDNKTDVRVVGQGKATDVTFRDLHFHSAGAEFAWNNGDLFFQKIACEVEGGGLTGTVLAKDGRLKYRAESTVPLHFFRPLFPQERAQKTFDAFEFDDESTASLSFSGESSLSDRGDFLITGELEMNSFRYRDVPLLRLKTALTLTPGQVDLTGLEAEFDYAESKWRKAHGGPESAIVSVDELTVDLVEGLVEVTNAQGTAWPQPVINLFAPKITKFIDPYRFSKPPEMLGNGQFDLRRPPLRTDFALEAKVPGLTGWNFIGKPLPFGDVTADLRFRHRHTTISRLRGKLFNGRVRAGIDVTVAKGSAPLVTGEVDWTDLAMSDLAVVYGIPKLDEGTLTGRLAFSLTGGKPGTLRGRGNIGIRGAPLFSVPVLGPLSPLVSGAFSDKEAGYQKAEDASLTFIARKGVFYTDDFTAVTRSLVFTGDGELDVPQQQFRMTVRMNGKGLLKILKVPLAPLLGLFQFTGSGPLDAPVWRNTPYTKPAEREEALLLKGPPKAIVVEE